MSTAYVASTHQGEAKEELLSENPFTLDVRWQDEVAFRFGAPFLLRGEVSSRYRSVAIPHEPL